MRMAWAKTSPHVLESLLVRVKDAMYGMLSLPCVPKIVEPRLSGTPTMIHSLLRLPIDKHPPGKPCRRI